MTTVDDPRTSALRSAASPRAAAGAIVAILLIVGGVEAAMGRLWICKCGTVKLWHGIVQSAENSQHLADWYAFTHVSHGLLFYAALWIVAPRLPATLRLITAVFLEGTWEIVENSPFIIDRYRAATISLDYYGDSIVNSLSDVMAMMIGFGLARRLPTWTSLALLIGMEAMLAFVIRDNLALNIIMLVHPIDAIKLWQMGG